MIAFMKPDKPKRKRMIPTKGLGAKVEQVVETVYWEGGAVGNERNWNEKTNWSNNKVPSLLNAVYIPRTPYFPRIKNGKTKISSLEIEAGTRLDLEADAYLQVNGMMDFSNGIKICGQLLNRGKIQIYATALAYILIDSNGVFENHGTIQTDKSKRDSVFIVKGGKLHDAGEFHVI